MNHSIVLFLASVEKSPIWFKEKILAETIKGIETSFDRIDCRTVIRELMIQTFPGVDLGQRVTSNLYYQLGQIRQDVLNEYIDVVRYSGYNTYGEGDTAALQEILKESGGLLK